MKKWELGTTLGEVEGGEVIETPDGGQMEMKGPRHEAGGIDMQLPVGSIVFSDRLTGPDGKTMAQREKARQSQIKKVSKAYKESPMDFINKFSLKRTLEQATQERMEDMMIQEMANIVDEYGGEFANGGKVYANGGNIWDEWGGAKGDRRVQTILKDLGYYNGPIKDQMDKKVGEAVKKFQKDRGLSVDGLVGPKTIAELTKVAYDWGPNPGKATMQTSKENLAGDSASVMRSPTNEHTLGENLLNMVINPDPYTKYSTSLADLVLSGLGGASAIPKVALGPSKPMAKQTAKNIARKYRKGNLSSWGEKANPRSVEAMKSKLMDTFGMTKDEAMKYAKKATGNLEEWLDFPQSVANKFAKGGEVSPTKARKILRDGSVRGHPLTDKQKRYFGWIAGKKKHQLGAIIGTAAPLLTTVLNKIGDKPIENQFANYGQGALESVGEMFAGAQSARDQSLSENQLALEGQRRANQNRAGSINMATALDQGLTAQGIRADQAALNQYSQTLSNLFSKKADIQMGVDKARMTGAQYTQDEREKQRDNFFTQLSTSLGNLSEGLLFMEAIKEKKKTGKKTAIEDLLNFSDIFNG